MIFLVEFNVKGYALYTNTKLHPKSRGVIIYVKDCITSYPCLELDNLHFQASVWCEMKISAAVTILIGGINRSGLITDINYEYLLSLIETAVAHRNKYALIFGDFNYSEIDWLTWSAERAQDSESSRLLEKLRDNYLFQLVTDPSRYREGKKQTIFWI